jgi:hypothetical protein
MQSPLKQAVGRFQSDFEREVQLSVALIGSPSLYQRVRAAFVGQGTSLNGWCTANGLNRQTVDRALMGKTTTRAALALVRRAVDAAREHA